MYTSDLQPYCSFVDFLGNVFGSHCEIVLHDFSEGVENSIIAIKNGHISGRKVGGSVTDLGLKIIKDKPYSNNNSLVNYSSKTKEGKILHSSVLFFEDENSNVTGMLCINIDYSRITTARDLLNEFASGIFKKDSEPFIQNTDSSKTVIEDFHTSIEDLTTSIIKNTVSEIGVPANRLSPEEKTEVVQKLSENGVFLIKGSVVKVARHLDTSEATVYRYLSKIE